MGGNPFVYYAPVRGNLFINRDDIIEEIIKIAITGEHKGNVWITGERQIGKTSLLHYFQDHSNSISGPVKLIGSDNDYNVALIFSNVQDFETRDKFYEILRQKMKEYFDFKLETGKNHYQDFIHALKYAHELGYYILFFLDEFDSFLQNLIYINPQEALQFLRQINKTSEYMEDLPNSPKVFSCVFTSNITLNDILKNIDTQVTGSPLNCVGMDLKKFTQEQIKDLATTYIKKNSQVKLSSKEIQFCFKMTKGYPYFVQRLFYLIYEEKLKNPGVKDCSTKVKKLYPDILVSTFRVWGGDLMPKRTKETTFNLIKDIGKEIGFNAIKFGFDWLKHEIGL